MSNKGIIPAAGYGTRMYMETNQSKEMLIDPVTGKYLIDYSLDLCYKYYIEPVVISRIEKEDLNSYLRSKNVEHIVLKSPGNEWADTVLKSQGLWGDKNILLLPDTRFEPEYVVRDMLDEIGWSDSGVVAAVHKIDPKESDKWGTVTGTGIHEKNSNHQMVAWGLLGWRKQALGLSLFSEMYPGGSWFAWNGISKLQLTSFKDITRTGKLEKY